MGMAGRFLRRIQNGYAHWCPGCEEMHTIAVDAPNSNGARWRFDGNLEAPSFSPSVNIAWGRLVDPSFVDEEPGDTGRCHYFIRNGQIKFCGDTTHALRGKIVALPELPDGYRDA